MLELRKVSRRFGGLRAVNNVSFTVEQDCIKAVIGPNGAGKTTLFNLIAGKLPLSSGKILFKKKQISGRKPHQVAARGIARTFQNIRLFPGMTALENVMVGRHLRTRAGFISAMLCLPNTWFEERSTRKKSMALLEMLGIGEFAHVEASSLSFGQTASRGDGPGLGRRA